MPAKTAPNSFAQVVPETDAFGRTADEFLHEVFESELCSECLGDADQHTAVIGPLGAWFAWCDTGSESSTEVEVSAQA